MKRQSVTVLAALAALATGSMACGSSGGAGNNDGGVPSGSGAISWKDNGTTQPTSFTSANRIVSPTLDMVQVVGSNSAGVGVGFGVATTPPLLPGSYVCGVGVVTLNYTVGSASSNVPTCTIDITTLGPASGDHIKGTFSAMVTLDNGMAKTVTDGVFDLPLMVINQ
jgi:hypothetical protein